jgi:hypothetical protein
MKFKIFVMTVGEDVVFETLDAVKRETKIPYNLTVWYHPTKGINMDTFNKIQSYTDDIIMCTKNQKNSGVGGYFQIYSDYDYLLGLCADSVLKPGYFDRLMKPFTIYSKVAFVGSGGHEDALRFDYEANNPYNLPDISGMWSRDAVNDIGGPLAAFHTYGFEPLEIFGRAISKGWKIVHARNIFTDGGLKGRKHTGTESMNKKEREDSLIFNGALQIEVDSMLYKGYNWWSNKL